MKSAKDKSIEIEPTKDISTEIKSVKSDAAEPVISITSGTPCVYMLLCDNGSLYTGWTNDFNKRFAAHMNGQGAKYTRSHKPVKPAYIEIMPDKSAAVKREAAIKKLPVNKKRQLISTPSNIIYST